MPLLISPDEALKENLEVMHLVKTHSIWFLDISDQTSPDRMDLEYSGKMYFAQKFLIPSKRIKRRAGLVEHNYDTIVSILVLPIDMDIFGGAFRIKKHFKSKIYQLIEVEITKLKYLNLSLNNIKEIKGLNNLKKIECFGFRLQ